MGMHRCAHPSCDTRIDTSLFACRHHWFRLPQRVRDEIGRAARAADQQPNARGNRGHLIAARVAAAHEAATRIWDGAH